MSKPTTGVRERPILFSGPMVKAILEGRKTQTRRVVRPQPRPGRYGPNHPTMPSGVIGHTPGQFGDGDYCVWEPPSGSQKISAIPWAESCWYRIEPECPHGQPGDRIWVRETHQFACGLDLKSAAEIGESAKDAGYRRAWAPVRYVADGMTANSGCLPDFGGEWGKKRTSIFMPRWASRINLEITEVRVERLHEITESDANAEGVGPGYVPNASGSTSCVGHRPMFVRRWDEINGKKHPWVSNPWVFVISFRRLETR